MDAIKRLYFKVNRGIALGVIIFVCLIAFFVVDAVGFYGEARTVKELIENYLAECGDLNVSIGKSGGIDDGLIRSFVDKYFTNNGDNRYTLRDSVRDTLTNSLKSSDNGGITECTFKLIEITNITKQGTNAVLASFRVQSDIAGKSNAPFLGVFDNLILYDYYGDTDGGTTSSSTVYYSVLLFKTGSKWKFASNDNGEIYGYGNNDNDIYIEY